jgi:hypothetical protein
MATPFGNKSPALIDEADLIALVSSAEVERQTIEYKRNLHKPNDDGKREFLRDISSFANSSGGYLVFGIDERSGVPVGLPGLASDNPDATIRMLRNTILDGTRPRIPDIEAEAMRLVNGHVSIVLRIPRSPFLPHMVLRDDFRFYARDVNGKYRMDVDELRRAFVQTGHAAALHALIHEFRLNAVIEPNVMYFGVPWERTALTDVPRFIGDLPDDVRETIIALAATISRYNALAIARPLSFSDAGKVQNMRGDIARTTQPLFTQAAYRIEEYLRQVGA